MSERDAHCKKCQVWPMRDGDLFCSWCGDEVTQLLARDRPVRIYVDRHTPTSVTVPILTNLSPAPVSMQPVGHPDWLDVSLPSDAVKPGEELSVTLGVDPNRMDAIPNGDELVFKPAAASGGFKEVRVEVWVWLAPPEVTVLPLTAFTGRGSAKSELQIETNTEISIESLTFEPPLLSLDEPTPLEVTELDKPVALGVQLNLPEHQTSQAQTVSYEMRLDGYAQPLSGTFELTVKRSATIRVDSSGSELTREIIPDFEEPLTIALTNAGEETLEIYGISVEARDPRARITVRPEKERFSVEPGKQATVKLRALADPDLPSGSYFFTASFDANDPVADHRQIPLNIKVVDETYDDYIAFDFGTTDSAVARFLLNELKPDTLDLEGVNDPKIYSNIFFTSYDEQSEPPYKWIIGHLAKDRGRLNREQFVRAVKTKVGLPERIKIDFKDQAVSRELSPEDVAEFIIRDLLRLTRQALRKKPAYVILSIPTRFTKRRSVLLQAAFRRAAESLSLNLVGDVETIDESLAAGLFYILRRGPNDEMVKRKSSYTMMILDFGGGTTDITVFKVRQRLAFSGEVDQIEEVEILGAWGDATLGGEGITTDIAELLAERFLGRRFDPRFDPPYVKNLEGTAEAVKLAISDLLRLGQLGAGAEFDRTISDPNLTLRSSLASLEAKSYDAAALRAFVENYQSKGRQLQVSSAEFPGRTAAIGEDDVVAIYESKLRKLKYEVDLMMARIGAPEAPKPDGEARSLKVDVLLLAGQSSQFPTVKQIFQDLAVQPPDFVRNEVGEKVLKECVSMGALYWKLGGGGPSFNVKGRSRLWHCLGRVDPRALGATTFQEFVPWGCTYPHVSKEIPSTRVEGDKVVLRVLENLSMNSKPKLEEYRRFELTVPPPVKDEYACRLLVNEYGEVEAECKVKGKWERMR